MKIGFLNLLTLIFVAFKLANIITWSWWLVFLPTIVSVVLGVIFFTSVFILAGMKGK